MNDRTQNILIAVLGVLALALIVKDQYGSAMVIGGILGGFLSQKTLTEKQSEAINEYAIDNMGDKQ